MMIYAEVQVYFRGLLTLGEMEVKGQLCTQQRKGFG